MLLKKKIKVLEEEKNKLEHKLKCSKVYAGSLKNRLFSYDNFITNEKLFRATTGLEVEKFKISYEYLNPGENCENIKYHEPATRERKKIGQMFRPHRAFCHLRIKTRTSTKTC